MTATETAGMRFGEGRPKICVPLTGVGMPALLREIQAVSCLPADLYEWRADRFFGDLGGALEALRQGLPRRPLICTMRTEREGGAAELSEEEYERGLNRLLEIGGFALLDIELSCGEERVLRLVKAAKEKGVGVIVSQHDFEKTPHPDQMIETLLRMKALGADLPKLAVTPRTPGDVLALMTASRRAADQIGPVITVSMGELGKVSRAAGEITGSCVTFGAGVNASAPGQLDCEDLLAILEDLSPRG